MLPTDNDTTIPMVSLVICTHNRAAQLGLCLASLRQLRFAGTWELVMVDNGSTDDTSAIIESFRTTLPCKVTVVYEPIPGLGRARNSGWNAARGGIIAFTDDDCYPYATYLEEIAAVFSEQPSLGFTGGRVLLFDAADYKITIQEHDRREEMPPRSFISAGLINGANMAFRRAALESVGGFDANFGAGTRFPCEDVDILARMSGAGWEGAYDPRPVVDHHHGRKTEAQAQRLMKQYDQGRGAYYAKSLLNPALRNVTARHWFWQMRHQHWAITARELLAVLEYIGTRLLAMFAAK